jgi:threonine/homoserine/homoserine lactone efflux protein
VATLIALAAFSFVSVVTPGPNNVLLWASGARFGVARTIRHVVGTALGIGAMTLAAGAGLAAVVTTVPALAIVMKVGATIYLLFLARSIARSHGVGIGELSRPLGLLEGAAFQLINPKAWIFALSAVTAFRPADLPAFGGSVLVAGTMMAVILPTETLWAAAGGAINRLLTSDRRARAVSLALAALVVVTVLSVWV